MNKMEEAIDRIKALECPTGEVENSVALILEDYGVADSDKVYVNRDNRLDRGDVEAYRVKIAGEGQTFVVLAKSGYDGYVAKVVDVLQ